MCGRHLTESVFDSLMLVRSFVRETGYRWYADVGVAMQPRLRLNADHVTGTMMVGDPGQERYESISPIYYRGADIVLIVYSPFVEASWLRAKKWLEDMPTMVPDARVVLVSTKQDLPSTPESQAMDVEAEGYIVALGYDLIKTSSVSGAGVEQLLRRVWEHLDAIAEANS